MCKRKTHVQQRGCVAFNLTTLPPIPPKKKNPKNNLSSSLPRFAVVKKYSKHPSDMKLCKSTPNIFRAVSASQWYNTSVSKLRSIFFATKNTMEIGGWCLNRSRSGWKVTGSLEIPNISAPPCSAPHCWGCGTCKNAWDFAKHQARFWHG